MHFYNFSDLVHDLQGLTRSVFLNSVSTTEVSLSVTELVLQHPACWNKSPGKRR